MELPFRDVQYVYTNKCNLANETNYCTVPKHVTQRASFDKIQEACKIFKNHNLQVKVLGGNPSDESDFECFIKWMNFLDLDYVVTDNAMNFPSSYDEYMEKPNPMLLYGVKGLMLSMDTLGKSNIGGCSFIKSMKAKQFLYHLKHNIYKYRKQFNYLGANVVINTMNYKEIPKIVEFLTEHNAVANLCPLIVGKNKDFVFRISESVFSLDKLNNRYEKLKELVSKLIEMKESGYKIGVPVEYLENLPDVVEKNYWSWNCYHINTIPILRVNTDLSLMVCSDLVGDKVSKYSIFDIEDKFEEINTAWINDNQRIRCCENNGCYWSNIVIANIYRSKGLGTLEATRRNL